MSDRIAGYLLTDADFFALLKAGDGRTTYTLEGLPREPELVDIRRSPDSSPWPQSASGWWLRMRSPGLPEVADGRELPRQLLRLRTDDVPVASSYLMTTLCVAIDEFTNHPPSTPEMNAGRSLLLECQDALDDASRERDRLRDEVEQLRLIMGDYRLDGAEADRLYQQGWREAMAQRDLKDARRRGTAMPPVTVFPGRRTLMRDPERSLPLLEPGAAIPVTTNGGPTGEAVNFWREPDGSITADIRLIPTPTPDFACDVCLNTPDEEGWLEHGRGCHTQSEDGGGGEYIEEADRSMQEAKATAPTSEQLQAIQQKYGPPPQEWFEEDTL